MGNSVSGEEDELDKFDGIDTLGYRVLGVQPNSPASNAGLVSFFDFLVGANGQILLGTAEGLEIGEEYDDVDFPALLQGFVGKPLELLVWNIKSQEKRLVTIVPTNDWGGAGLLGVTIRMDNYGGADERLIRVLEIERNSPAAIAGLVPQEDYLLGTAQKSLDSTAALADILQDHADRVVELYVYNTTSDVVRIVTLMPTWSWGGRGLLGAEVGTGYLHSLPSKCRNTNGNSVPVKVVTTRQRRQQQPPHKEEANHEGADEQLVMAPQLEMEPEPGQSHAMPLPDLHGAAAAAAASETEQEKEVMEPPKQEPESVMPAAEKPKEMVVPPPAPAAAVPPPPPPVQEAATNNETSSVAMKYSAPSAAATTRVAVSSSAAPPPPPPPPPAAPFAPSNTSYASAFLPPPPMSHLSSKNKQTEVDLR